ncbi:MAG: endonuclease III [Syntrophobacterales bacterium]|nr:endonuclease III [Syntrophobacterales bacterium]
MTETHGETSIDEIISILRNYLKDAVPVVTRLSQKRRDPFIVLVGTLLSLRTKDETTDRAIGRLMARAKTPLEILSLKDEELQELIYPVGFYRNKTKTLKEVSKIILEKYQGVVPDTVDELLNIRGVGRKTASLVLNEGYAKPAICVDTHVHRISNRLAIVETRNPHQTENDLTGVLPQKYWIIFNTLLVVFGQKVCTPISPFCSTCPLNHLCPQAGVTTHR